MIRRETGLPDDAQKPAGEMIRRNPGVSLVWVTKKYTLFNDGRGGTLFEIGAPLDVQWWCEGRSATYAEVMHSIETGLPILMEHAHKDGRGALRELERRLADALLLVPKEAA